MNKVGNTNNNIINDGIATIDENNWIYYSNGFGKMYKMKNDGSQESVISDVNNNGDLGYVNYEDMNVIDGWIYYVEDRTYASSNPTNYKYRLYKVKTDGSSRVKVISSEDSGKIENLNVAGDWIYYSEWNTSTNHTTIYKAKIDGSNKKGIVSSTKGDFAFLKVYGDWIYYVSESKIYKVKTDRSGKLGLSNGEVNNCGEFNVVGDWMFYSGRSIHYKVKMDGTMNSKII